MHFLKYIYCNTSSETNTVRRHLGALLPGPVQASIQLLLLMVGGLGVGQLKLCRCSSSWKYDEHAIGTCGNHCETLFVACIACILVWVQSLTGWHGIWCSMTIYTHTHAHTQILYIYTPPCVYPHCNIDCHGDLWGKIGKCLPVWKCEAAMEQLQPNVVTFNSSIDAARHRCRLCMSPSGGWFGPPISGN